MASDEEDVDLQALRSAVLASLKTKAKQVDGPKQQLLPKDEEELESLRQAALQSKKVEAQEVSQEIPSSRPFQKIYIGRRLPINHHNHLRQQNRFLWRNVSNPVNSNLITIQTLPLDSADGQPLKKFHRPTNFTDRPADKFHRPFHPQPHLKVLTQDEASSSPKVKPKSNDKFSRFESDSDSDDDSEFNFPLNSSDSDDNVSSTTADETRTDAGTTTVDVSEADDQSTMQDGSLGFHSSDKENEDSQSVASDKEAAEPNVDASSLTTNSKAEEANGIANENGVQRCAVAGGESNGIRDCCSMATKSDDPSISLSDTTGAAKLTNDMTKHVDSKETTETSVNINSANLISEDKLGQRQNDSKKELSPSPSLSSALTREKLEARRRKFESQPIVQPKNTKISLRDIVQSVQESEVNSVAPVSGQADSPHSTPHSSPRATRELVSSSNSEEGDSSESDRCKRCPTIRPKLSLSSAASSPSAKLSRQIAMADKEQDLRVSLRLKQEERLQQRMRHSSGSGWSSDDSSSSNHCSSPILKSVLSVVKVESRDSDRLRDSSPSHRFQRSIKDDNTCSRRRLPTKASESRHDSRRTRTKRRENRMPGWISSKHSEASVNPDGRPEGPSTSSTKPKLPVRMRLGLPVTSSTARAERKEAKKRRSASPSETLCPVESKTKRQSSTSSWQKDRLSRSSRKSGKREARVVRVAKKFSTSGDSVESTGKGVLAHDGELDQKIRRIQERNEAILRRQEEVAADRKKYS